MTLCLVTLSKGLSWTLSQILRAPLISLFPNPDTQINEANVDLSENQLNFFYPFPYITTKKSLLKVRQ